MNWKRPGSLRLRNDSRTESGLVKSETPVKKEMAFYIILLLLWARVCYFICMCYFCSYEMVIMKNLFRTVSVIALAGWFLACSERKSEACYEIIPAPLEIRENFSGGEFVLDDGVCIVYPGENEAMRHNALFLADYLKAATGRDYRVETGSRRKKNVTLQLDSSIKNPEGYRVNVSASGVVIAGASEAYSMAYKRCARLSL